MDGVDDDDDGRGSWERGTFSRFSLPAEEEKRLS